ncbi:acyl-CoA thioesterase [Sulfitobacter sp. M57]|uniref:acyl-CoA thioesterase n=1 Tax=unclassified Sulfitobacter TaxID=196795 RepID=UPI0023E26357|nr:MULTISPECIES: acyl-CoA thioesterase [unclassified Sulfitobacter]MDF3416324.1 acyl-CoA thioesterase [Sulfitobacter sp. KE5]MDF3423803.1 acyl-CoA thioesterase [Sulfitobacter sp. KE43]MDF3434870.1 acyl-CoA thioesterase [Sulfitobacter sp. KE42]MDF3460509.1 acyl-CoA thioesterase [Sulfitobacter sp. S74]MDF3464407.1 acyl-CoA thioesterase [Sulfitobacter sp. Ks18]
MSQTQTFDISFGDCDPVGIVFYPNAFRWMDATFHTLLRRYGGHSQVCKQLEAVGLGLVDASAQFKHPMRDGDTLDLRTQVVEWSQRTVTLGYEGRVQGKLAFTGREVRCLFKRSQNSIVAADLAQLRELLEGPNV